MKILHLLSLNKYSGAENVACQIISMLKSPDINFVYCSPDGPIREALKERNIDFQPLQSMSLKEVKKAIKIQKPDVIHAHDMRASLYAALVCGDIPLVSHIHNNNFDSRGLSPKAFLYKIAAKKAQHIFWVSKTAFSGYHFHKNFEQKSSILVNVIDTQKLEKKLLDDKEKYNYDVLFLGRLTPQKNPYRLLDIFNKLIEIKPDVKCAIVGTGELEEEIKNLAISKKLTDNVSFLGFKSNPYKILADSKVMVLTSLWEGTPMVALEAMSLGIPIVSTPTDGMVDVVKNGVTGYLTDSDEEFVESVLKILNDKDLREKLSDQSVSRAKEIMNIDNYKDAILNVYKNALANK